MDYNLLQEANMTQLEFAGIVGVSRPTVCLWVNGRHKPARRLRPVLLRLERAMRDMIHEGQLPAREAEREVTFQNLIRRVHG